MSSASRGIVAAIAALVIANAAAPAPAADAAIGPREETQVQKAGSQPLRVCADPNNLPFSNRAEEGFENRIATLVARDLGRPLTYFWQPQRRGFARLTLNAGRCDVIVGVLPGTERMLTTEPYYRSTFVFVSRPGGSAVRSFDDRRLASMRVGIQLTGDDYGNPPPAQALAARGLVGQVRGFPVYGDYSSASPQRAIVDAVAAKEIDTAAVWGPVGGYFAAREHPPLNVSPLGDQRDRSGVTFAFAIAMAVRADDHALQQQLDRTIRTHRSEIAAILRAFNVPTLPLTVARGGSAS